MNQEREPTAAPPAPAPLSSPVFSIDSGEGKEAPDGWQPSPEVRQAATEAGHNPAEVRDELHDLETRGRAHPLPANWQPNAADRAYARQLGLDPDAPTMARKFVARHRARGTKRCEWSAEWQSWCLMEPGFQRPGGGKPDPKQWLYGQPAFQNAADAGAAL